MADDIFTPYLSDPMVQKIPERSLSHLNDPELNDVIRALDQITRGVRDFSRVHPLRSHQTTTGRFSATISIARALAFLDTAHSTQSVNEIVERIWNVTPTTTQRKSFNDSVYGTVMSNMISSGTIQFDTSKQRVQQVMPYPVSSKLYIYDHFLHKPAIFDQQKNHFNIIHSVQDFPELTSVLETNAPNPGDFPRDLSALQSIDVILPYNIGGRPFTFSQTYISGEKSFKTWEAVLESVDNVRIGLRELLVIQGDMGGYITQTEISEITGMPPRIVNRLIRNISNMGLALKTRTLQMGDALSRPTSGTLLNMNYYEYNNATDILRLIRSVPDSRSILETLRRHGTLSEDDLLDEYEVSIVQSVRNTLDGMGLISKEPLSDGILVIAPNKNGQKFLFDVLAVAANSRIITDPDYDIKNKLSAMFEKVDEDKLNKVTGQLTFDFFKAQEDELRR
jgi:hypothetical protein